MVREMTSGKSVSKQNAEMDRIIEMIEYMEKHKVMKGMTWHIIPRPENDEYYLLLVTSPRLPKDRYCAASLWKKYIHGSKKLLKHELDCALMSIKDVFKHPEFYTD